MFKRYFMLAAMALSLVLAGCGSDVKLDQPAEGSSTAAGAGAGGAQGQGAGQSSVTQVQADASAADKAGPVGVAKVIYFDYDSYTVKPDYQSVVDQHARFCNRAPTPAWCWRATPTSAAAASTTWPWARSAPRPCAAR